MGDWTGPSSGATLTIWVILGQCVESAETSVLLVITWKGDNTLKSLPLLACCKDYMRKSKSGAEFLAWRCLCACMHVCMYVCFNKSWNFARLQKFEIHMPHFPPLCRKGFSKIWELLTSGLKPWAEDVITRVGELRGLSWTTDVPFPWTSINCCTKCLIEHCHLDPAHAKTLFPSASENPSCLLDGNRLVGPRGREETQEVVGLTLPGLAVWTLIFQEKERVLTFGTN